MVITQGTGKKGHHGKYGKRVMLRAGGRRESTQGKGPRWRVAGRRVLLEVGAGELTRGRAPRWGTGEEEGDARLRPRTAAAEALST